MVKRDRKSLLSQSPKLPVHNACAAVYAMVLRCSFVLHLWCVQVSGTSLSDQVSWDSITFGDALLAPTEIYVQRLLSLISNVDVKVSHHIFNAMHCIAHHLAFPSSPADDKMASCWCSALAYLT